MVMYPRFQKYYKSMYGIKVNDQNRNNLFKFEDKFSKQDHINNNPLISPDLGTSELAMLSSNSIVEENHYGDNVSTDVVLNYISQMLMEEDIEENSYVYQESLSLQEAEKSFYEAIGEKYPPLSEIDSENFADQFFNIPDEIVTKNYDNGYGFICNSNMIVENSEKNCEIGGYIFPCVSYPATSDTNSGNSTDGFVDSPISTLRVPDTLYENKSVVQLQIEIQETDFFVPKHNTLFVESENDGLLVKLEENYENGYFNESSKGKKSRDHDVIDLDEERSNKQSASYVESTVRSEMFDSVLLSNGEQSESELRESLVETGKNLGQNGNIRKIRGKKKIGKKDVVDLRTLLTLCAQAVSGNDQRTTYELLKKIRQHSSPNGDGMQRISHYFADGLETRIGGPDTKIHTNFFGIKTSASDILKAYHLFLAVCPYKKLSIYFSNMTIMRMAEKATKLHIIDFGIFYGFQWPCLIQRLSSRLGGPPNLRITGIDFPQPGFRPTERIRETERRLTNYAETFNVPFEFSGIVQKWETIQIEDLKIRADEVVIVNCMYRLRHLFDETVMVDSPRNIVLDLIKKMNPDAFIQGIVNGAYGAPFFLTRFREALFHFSTLFDILEANVPRESRERMLLEKEIFGREAINVISCEGSERIERPETYKQWQVRNSRAGFVQIPLDREMMKMMKEKVKTCYHKDFLIDEDGHWMLQGWKGRVAYGISAWRPSY